MPLQNEESDLDKSNAGRMLKALPFLTIILLLAGWSAGFYILQLSDPDSVADSLRCIIFFGGLLVAVILGALLGLFLKRSIWKSLIRRSSRN